ncbi:MAG: hypothetical protein WD556_06265 [Actinomycetota bacterium]
MDTPTICRWGLPDGLSCEEPGVHLSFRGIDDRVMWSIACQRHADENQECAWYWFTYLDNKDLGKLVRIAARDWRTQRKLPEAYAVPP